MKLSKRLTAIVNMIPSNTKVIDVGCDHALLDIFLTFNKPNVKCLAIDISEKTIDKANNNIKKYHLENRIEVLLNDGLKKLNINHNDYVVIAGLGTFSIIKILEDINYNVNNLIIQTNTNSELLLKKIISKGFELLEFTNVKEYKKYNIFKFKKVALD